MSNRAVPKYGGRGRPWHPDFIKYVEAIANHPVYAGMPDAFSEPGRVQWEAPSNRKSGKFKDTHNKRRQWWRQKAIEIGIDPSASEWISRTAKQIHPFKKKPCKICGRVLELRYTYPGKLLIERMRKLGFKADLQEGELITIQELLTRLYALYGDDLLKSLPIIFSTPKRNLEQIPRALADWVSWLDQQFIPEEPSLLSPGAYSNAPDRFDGFHSDNLCCRSTADKGRSKSNLASYVTDRRVFEHWAAGDWVAADRMMGALRAAQFEKQSCKNGHPGPCSADHIGPISLGFTHRPCFQALCKSCNSAKNNRMSASDIRFLMEHEKKGETVSSWHSKALWNLRKLSGAEDNETALRLSKLLRDNRHVLMAALKRIADAGYYVFLTTLLELEHADYDVTFINLKIVDHITHFDQMDKSKRVTKYAAEQKARRCRVALQELAAYFEKENRSSFVVGNEASEVALERCLSELQKLGSIPLDKQIGAAVLAGDAEFAPLIPDINAIDKKQYAAARAALEDHMDIVGGLLSSMWNDDRYVRS